MRTEFDIKIKWCKRPETIQVNMETRDMSYEVGYPHRKKIW